MRRLSIALVATVSAVAFTQVALAADMPVKAPVAPVAAPYNWTGFYVGGNVGYSWATADNDLSISQQANPSLFATLSGTDSNKLKGVIGGVQAGYNWQFNPNWLLGVEADFQASGQKGTTVYGATIIIPSGLGNNPATVTDSHKLDWFGTVRGRLGVTSDRWLVYATGGLAYGQVKVSGSVQPANDFSFVANAPIVWDQSTTKVGWTIGAGVENALSGNWRWKIEYLYVDLGSVTANASGGVGTIANNPPGNCYAAVGAPGCTPMNVPASGTVTSKLVDNIVRVGINYKFP
jgi:outer membrane immunogenic protein